MQCRPEGMCIAACALRPGQCLASLLHCHGLDGQSQPEPQMSGIQRCCQSTVMAAAGEAITGSSANPRTAWLGSLVGLAVNS